MAGAIGARAAPDETTGATRSYVDLASAHATFDCSPAPIGEGTAPTIRSNPAGTVAWWYCATTSGEWRVNWAAATARQMSVRNMAAEIRAVILSDDRKAAFDAVVARNVRVPVNSPELLAVWQPYVAEMNAGKPAALPGAPLPPRAPGGTMSSLLVFAR